MISNIIASRLIKSLKDFDNEKVKSVEKEVKNESQDFRLYISKLEEELSELGKREQERQHKEDSDFKSYLVELEESLSEVEKKEITMRANKVCPVKIISTESKDIIDAEFTEKEAEKKDIIDAEFTEKEAEKKDNQAIKLKKESNAPIDVNIAKDVKEKITMRANKVCPVKIISTKSKNVVEVEPTKEMKDSSKKEVHLLNHLIQHLRNFNISHLPPVRMITGLYEVDIIQNSGNIVKLSVDINGLLYNDAIKFFIGHINPGDEYKIPPVMMTELSLRAIVNGAKIPDNCIITESLFSLNKLLDLQTLKEKDKDKRGKVFESAAKAISDPDIYNGILKAAAGEAFRFVFAKYKNSTEFSIVSSKRNLSSNLSSDKLLATKEIWINIKDNKVNLTTKDCK